MSVVKKELRISTVSHEDFTEYDFIPVATFYFRNASGDYIFIHTASRSAAQEWINENYGKHYTVVASKIQKGKPLGEGSRPAYGTASRKK